MNATGPAPRVIPKADGHWLFGSAFDVARSPHRFVAELAQDNAGIARFRILNRPFVAVASADYVRQILVTRHARYQRSFHYRNRVIGSGLLTTDGPHWLKRRRQIVPAFRADTLRGVVPAARDATLRRMERWEELRSAGQPVPISSEMQALTLSVIGRALLSTEVGEDSAARFAGAVRDSLRLTRQRNMSMFRTPSWMPTPGNRRLLAVRDALDEFIGPKIRAREAEGPYAPPDILDALLAARDPETGEALDYQALLDETKTLFVAGFETTATALTWTLYLLARHPDVARRWHRELDEVLGGRLPEWEDLERLTYLHQIISESMRLYPPVYTLGRECIEDDELDGYSIRSGTVLLLSVFGIHRDPKWWQDPETFRPERFADDWPTQAYLPFASGKHMCIGNNFSLAEMAVTLSIIGQRYELEPVESQPVQESAQITLVPAREIPLRLARR